MMKGLVRACTQKGVCQWLFDSTGVETRVSKGKREDYLEKDCWKRHKSGGMDELGIMLTENVELISRCDDLLDALRWDEEMNFTMNHDLNLFK